MRLTLRVVDGGGGVGVISWFGRRLARLRPKPRPTGTPDPVPGSRPHSGSLGFDDGGPGVGLDSSANRLDGRFGHEAGRPGLDPPGKTGGSCAEPAQNTARMRPLRRARGAAPSRRMAPPAHGRGRRSARLLRVASARSSAIKRGRARCESCTRHQRLPYGQTA
jgi:hypothetical protein